MINRDNWKLTKKYLEFRQVEEQVAKGTLKTDKTYLRYLLEWAQEIHFSKAQSIRPTLPEFMLEGRLDGEEGQLSGVHIKKTLLTARKFFQWCKDYQVGFASIRPQWIRSLKIKRLGQAPIQRESVTFEQILQIANTPVDNLPDMRTRAMAVFLYLSGMRIGAFVTLPLEAVDIEKREVKQFPELGVRTKNGKKAKTILLPIPELLEIVKEWDDLVRVEISQNGFWFAPLRPDTGKIDKENLEVGDSRVSLARRNLKVWMLKNDLAYRSPHKFRHGHIRWGRDHSKDISDFKAVSENVMHSSMQITDDIYSSFSGSELKNRIEGLALIPKTENSELINLLQELLNNLKT